MIGALSTSMRHLLLAAWIASLTAITPGQAQQMGLPGRGLELARQLCAHCHTVERQPARSPNENAPSFQAIAAVPGMTSIALSAALNTSHRTMPNIMLTAEEQADIIAYVLSLK